MGRETKARATVSDLLKWVGKGNIRYPHNVMNRMDSIEKIWRLAVMILLLVGPALLLSVLTA